jgi:hypothetical protein
MLWHLEYGARQFTPEKAEPPAFLNAKQIRLDQEPSFLLYPMYPMYPK